MRKRKTIEDKLRIYRVGMKRGRHEGGTLWQEYGIWISDLEISRITNCRICGCVS